MDKYVLVTGASKGIGRATALHLAEKGFKVFAGVRNPADGEGLQREGGAALTPLLLDVTNQDQIEQAARQIARTVGKEGLAGLVNNAGVAVAAPLEFLPIAELRHQLEVNVVGQVAVTQAVLPCLRQARGRIINITSIGGRVAGPMIGAYHASKFALEAVSDTLRQELKPAGIEVVAIEPGTIATPIWETSTATALKMRELMPSQAEQYYSEAFKKSLDGAARSAKIGIAPVKVAEVIGKALTASRPRTRYLVGRDAIIAGNIAPWLPDRVRDRLLNLAGLG